MLTQINPLTRMPTDPRVAARGRAPSRRRAWRPGAGLYVLVAVAAFVTFVSPASAATASPAWSIRSLAGPTNFAPGDTSGNDTYTVLVTNAGSLPTDGGPVTITDTLPPGVTPAEVAGRDYKSLNSLSCTTTPVQCTYSGVVPAGDVLEMIIAVTTEPSVSGSLTNAATVTGGGGAPASTSAENPVSSTPAPFGISGFSFGVSGVDGARDTQAGGHPYALTTTLDFDTASVAQASFPIVDYAPAENVKDTVVDLPLGLVGNPQTAPRCPLDEQQIIKEVAKCPANTKIGEVTLRSELGVASSLQPITFATTVSSLYNLVPEHGHPAEFGFSFAGIVAAHLYPSIVRTSTGYVLRVITPNTPSEFVFPGEQGFINDVSLTFFGDPASHDGSGNQPAPFFTNPVDCSASGLSATVHVDTWTHQGRVNADGTPDFGDPNWIAATSTLPPVTGCNALQFNPTIAVQPDTAQADSPTGLTVDLKVPQAPNAPGVLATPELKKAVVTLPQGMSVSPSAADGLEACSPAQIGLEGNSSPSCPDASKIGTVELDTALLAGPIGGSVYLATQNQNPFGSLMALYIVVDDPITGVLIKLPGEVSLDPVTGQLTTTFDNNPQLPFSALKLHFKGGARAPLATPQACGTYTTTASLTPWSAPDSGPPATPSSSFLVTSGCSAGFAPSFTAGTTSNQAGGFSPFSVTFSRTDQDQYLNGLTVKTPPGLLGILKSVVQCPEPLASQGACGPESLIGHVTTGAGPGPDPFYLSGSVFLTGPYKGAPFGLSVVVPAIAGPFNLGNVVVRASINVDPRTSALTITSDPLPSMLQGIPLQIRTVNVTVDRPGFMFNPTNCNPLAINGSISSLQGASALVSSRFQAANCAALPFKPKFTVLTQAKTSKADGAYLHVKVVSGPGQANIGKVKVDLPKQLPSRLTTLQKACTAAVFEANPANCPAASVVGTGTAVTPVLKNALTGPAYLVSHAAAAFPDLEIVLQGEGITLDLDGNTNIKKGITSSTFNSVPDAPISTFDLVLPEGPHSALAANGNFCTATKTVTVTKRVSRRVHGRLVHVLKKVKQLVAEPLVMPTVLTGQNGAVIKQTTKIAVAGCVKPKVKKKAKKQGKKHKKRSKGKGK
jgi:uncharacterized repeat protein (TIGR01451 family)